MKSMTSILKWRHNGGGLNGAALAMCLAFQCAMVGAAPLYQNDFEKADAGKVPEEFLVLDGLFAVKEENGNKVLELPGAPLDSFGVLFGPTEKSGVAVEAKIFGTGKGRRYPTFGVGLNGVGGYRLQISPGKKLLELYKGDDVVASVPCEWKSGGWTHLWLQVRPVKEGEVAVEGKIWGAGETQPDKWQLTFSDKSPAAAGRASIWGSPYSGTPIQFDQLAVHRVSDK